MNGPFIFAPVFMFDCIDHWGVTVRFFRFIRVRVAFLSGHGQTFGQNGDNSEQSG